MTNWGKRIKLEGKPTRRIVLTVLLTGMLVLGFNVLPAAASHPWPMFRHDLQHTGRSPFIGAQGPVVKWTYAVGDAIRSSPAVAEDGTIYIGANDGNLHAINPDGTYKWSYPTGGVLYSSPAIAADGTVYIGSWYESGPHAGAVYAIYPNGTLRWRYPSSGYILEIHSSPAVDPSSGVIYVGGASSSPWAGKMYAIDPDGTLKCEFTADPSGWMTASPAIREDGKILIGDYNNPDGILWALNPEDCSVYDWVQIPNPSGEIDIFSSAAIGSDGMIYLGGSHGDGNVSLWAVNPDLTIAWNFPTGGYVPGSPAIGQDGSIYVGSYDDKLYAINPDGTEKWAYTTGGDVFSSPAVGADGTIYVGSNDGVVYAINSNGALLWSYQTGDAVYSSPAIGSDGTVYVGSYDGNLYAFSTHCQVSPANLDFGWLFLGSYLEKTFTITNTGEETLNGTVNESCDHYSIVSGGGPYSLGTGDSVVVTVRFQPAYAGQHECIIETGNALCPSVFCSGVGTGCQVSPTELDFGTITVGDYLDDTFTITNIGEEILSGTVSESCGHYDVVSGAGAYSLNPGDWLTVTVRFEPASDGQHNCTVETGNALCNNVHCTGVGWSPCQVWPTSLSFGWVNLGSYLDKNFTMANLGEGVLTGTVTESCDHYDIVSGGGTYSLGPGDSVTVTVRFAPVSAGQHNCVIETGNELCSEVSCIGVGEVEAYWYWKLAYEDYAPSGMPDIDQKQDNWIKEETTQWTFCGPCAVANCFKWFDSKYNEGFGGWPGDGMDAFPLVRDYMDQLAPHSGWDDHDPWNVDHIGTQWNPGVGWPPATDQPFVAGTQPQPSSMPPWGELVERLAWYFDTDGIQTGYCNHAGTNILDMQQGIQNWLNSEMFEDASYLADTLCVAITARPTFAYVESLVEKSENVILLLGFWYPGEAPLQQQYQEFIRGDVNGNGYLDAGDVLACALGGPFDCDDAKDANDDGILNVGIDSADCEYISDYLFSGGPAPPAPYPNCGLDPTPDELDCASFAACGQWWRIGGHYVTMAGVNSGEQKIAVSDPFIDAAELDLAEGRVGDGWLIEHFWGSHDPAVHNDEGNVSHDIYAVQVSHDPCALWRLVDYPVSSDPYYWTESFFEQNIPDEFLTLTQPWDGVSPIFTEVEYCIHVSPWDYRGDCNGDGEVDIADVIWELNYLFKNGAPPPWPAGDVNCDGVEDLGDVIFKLNYLFKDGDFPRCCGP